MLNIIISGINGKMGNFVYDSAIKHGHAVVCGVDEITLGRTECPVYKSFDEVKHFADAIIDFSSPTSLNGLLKYAKANKIPLVIGTTDYNQNQEKEILTASECIPIFKSANTSLGVNLILKLCSLATKWLNGFDIEIVDKHHKYKKDSPSGTANLILNAIKKQLEYTPSPVYGRNGKTPRQTNEIGVHSVRGGTVVGEHSVFFFGENESVTITHTAYSKELFADGAIKATEFIANKKSGLYDMNDIVK